MKQLKKVFLVSALILASTNFAFGSALASTDESTTSTSEPATTTVVTAAPPVEQQVPGSESQPVIDEAPEPVTEKNAAVESESLLVKWVQMVALLILVAMVGWFVYERMFKSTRRQIVAGETILRRNGPSATVTVYPVTSERSVLKPEPATMAEKLQIVEPIISTAKVEPIIATARPERPILTTSISSVPTLVNNPEGDLPNVVSETMSNGDTENVESELTKIEPEVSAAERRIVQPPQIGEQSSFAKHEWWDKDREWCLVSPLGMSSDVVCDIGTAGSLAIAAASLRGHKHKVSSEPCQDAFSLRMATSQANQSFLIAVLCDGMSSAKHSEYGARRTSQLLAYILSEVIEDGREVTEQNIEAVLPDLFKYCKQNLIPQKRNQFGAPGIVGKESVESDFNTTVTFLIIPTSSNQDETVEVIVGSIGDSAVFVLHNSTSSWEEVAKLEMNAEILNPATNAFPATFDAQLSTIRVEKTDLIIATSDGVGNFISVRGSQTLLGNYLARQWAKPVNLPTFINDVGFDLRSADDDRTTIAIWLSRS